MDPDLRSYRVALTILEIATTTVDESPDGRIAGTIDVSVMTGGTIGGSIVKTTVARIGMVTVGIAVTSVAGMIEIFARLTRMRGSLGILPFESMYALEARRSRPRVRREALRQNPQAGTVRQGGTPRPKRVSCRGPMPEVSTGKVIG